MHILRDIANFVILQQLVKIENFYPGIGLPPGGMAPLPPGDSSYTPGDSSLPPPGWVSDPGVGNFPYKRGALVSAEISSDYFRGLRMRLILAVVAFILRSVRGSRILTINSVIQQVASYSWYLLTV